ncbi:PH domain-containing protein [Natronoarchaeum rubrum]|uniref:PH domain-containing protein n=1 Tax=Natronoarchaeum rubrum TaxID=755311 RepID=UPI0021126558|nr:PH domain-containing protein [Natronoarchaeum rubrum]
MGLFDGKNEEDVILENADLGCEPQNEYVSKKRVEKVDEYLEPGEKVHFLAKDGGGQLKIDGEKEDGILNVRTVVTDRRVLFIGSKMIGSTQTSIDYKDISSVEVSFGMVQKRLNLETDSKVFGIGVGKLDKEEVQDMAQFVREQTREDPELSNSSSGSGDTSDTSDEEDPLDKLERLGDLRDDGVITEDEFQEKKESLLNQI